MVTDTLQLGGLLSPELGEWARPPCTVSFSCWLASFHLQKGKNKEHPRNVLLCLWWSRAKREMFTVGSPVCFKARCCLDFHMEHFHSFDEENRREHSLFSVAEILSRTFPCVRSETKNEEPWKDFYSSSFTDLNSLILKKLYLLVFLDQALFHLGCKWCEHTCQIIV